MSLVSGSSGWDVPVNVAAVDLENTLRQVHTKYATPEYILLALYGLYCLIAMQYVIKSVHKEEKTSGGFIVLCKVVVINLIICGGIAAFVKFFPQNKIAAIFTNFLNAKSFSPLMVIIVPFLCIAAGFLWGMFTKILFSERKGS